MALLEDLVDQVLMALSSLEEVDDLLSVVVDVSAVVVGVLNRLLRRDKLAYVDGR